MQRSISRRLVALAVGMLMAGFSLPAVAERGDDAERKSKNGHAEGTIGEVMVAVEYGRPEMRGRDIFGALVPWGKVWRTGADEATTVTFGGDVMVGGEKLAGGTYGLFTVPGEKEWTVIFNRVANQWGAYEYSEAEDALRVTVPSEAAESTEALTFEVTDSGISLRWAEVQVNVPVTAGS